jgi:inosine-uridine nucleoside N-ribohydrolase
VGVTPGSFPDKDCSQQWAQYIIKKYPHNLTSNNQAEDAVSLYRKILAAQPDQSVTIVTVGFFTNLANLLNSGADNYSSLSGKDLVAKKVKQLVSMAASLGKDGKGGNEFNVVVDAQASIKVFNEWPTPMIISGFEIGNVIYTGIPLISNSSITNSPVKDAFKVALEKDKNIIGRNSWDQTAVLVAVKGIEPYFGYRKLNLKIHEDGKSTLAPGDKFTYLTFKQTPEQIAKVIEELMAHQPVKR